MDTDNLKTAWNNILDSNGDKFNHLFLASVIAVLCESSPITLDLKDIQRFWSGGVFRLKYDMVVDGENGSITFSLMPK